MAQLPDGLVTVKTARDGFITCDAALDQLVEPTGCVPHIHGSGSSVEAWKAALADVADGVITDMRCDHAVTHWAG